MKKITLLLVMLFSSVTCFSQFTEGFETEIPASFAINNGGSTNGWEHSSSPDGGAHTGSGVARIVYGSVAHDDDLITPQITVMSGVNDRLSFWVRSRSTTFLEPYQVLLSTTDTAPASFSVTLQAEQNAPGTWENIEVNLNAYIGQSVYIAIKATGTNEWELYVDDVVNDGNPSCIAPSALTAGNITATGADLGWTSGGSGEADWEVAVQAVGTGVPAGSGMSTAGVNPYTANGLSPATDYEYYVRAVCGGGDFSAWSGPLTFTTACATITPDYTNDFSVFPGNCWEEGVDTDIATGPSNTNGDWATDDFLNAFANGSAAKINIYGDAIQDWLVSPVFDLSADGYELKFDVGAVAWNGTVAETPNPMGSDDEVQVLISNDNGSTWVNLDTFNVANAPSPSGDAKTYDLTGYTSATTKIAFWATAGTVDDDEDYDFFIDNFVVRTPPACIEPSALTAGNITATGADLGWTSGGSGEADWEVAIQAAGTGVPVGAGVSTSGANPYMATGLTAATNYEFYVRANCGGSGYSTWIGPFNFATLCGTVTPSYTNDFTTFPGNCWEEGDNTDVATGPNGGDGVWIADGFLNSGSTGAARVNLFADTTKDWLVTPTFDLSAGSYGLAFDIGITDYFDATDSAMGSDDEVQVLISSDNGATWTVLEAFNAGNTPSNSGDAKLYDLAAYTSATTKFAFWANDGAVNDPEDYNIYIDNFIVDAYAVLGVEELQTLEGFKYFPNPVNNRLTVQAQNNIESLQIVSMLGQVVRTAQPNVQSYSLDISDLSSGIYFIKAKVNNTEGTFRVVKQ